MRYTVIAIVAVAILAGIGYLCYLSYDQFIRVTPAPDVPTFTPTTQVVKEDEFEKLAKEDPVAMLAQCLSRYTREVKTGYHCTMEKQERPNGIPKHPEMPVVEIVDVWVRGDVPDPATNKTAIEVQMKWLAGAKSALGAEIRGTIYSEKPDAKNPKKVVPWRPAASFMKEGPAMPPDGKDAKEQSRYCIRDAGFYHSMLRTQKAWEARKSAGELKTEYLGKKTHEKIGRECYVIKRICPRIEIDAFRFGDPASTDPAEVAKEGFTEVTIYIDVERWIQVGTELYRTEPDGTRVLVGTYYYRDLQLNPTFPPDVFTAEGLKK